MPNLCTLQSVMERKSVMQNDIIHLLSANVLYIYIYIYSVQRTLANIVSML